MKLLVLVSLALTLASPLAVASSDHDQHGAGAQHKLELNAGKKWATDMPLRKAMSAMRKSVVDVLVAVHGGKVTPAMFDASAKVVAAEVSYVIANCKLDPKADAQLHVVIGDIMNGASALEGKRPGTPQADGLVEVARALNAYGAHFDHPGWKAIDLGH